MKRITLFLILLASIISYAQTPVYVNIVFASTSATSDSFYVPTGYCLSGILMPASFTDTLTFQASINGGIATTWFSIVKNDGTAYIQTCLTSANAVPLDPKIFYPWRCLRAVTTTTDKATVTIKGVCVPYLTNTK